ncbi:helix-turn-helix transcriptional regulator [Jeongeupia naejangsanensis]|uniref:Helix-turn-helix transcriptional regulator n=1 Tax=Jeongeupia naejangsanensis TaxID=613195 RepID=A0ABS2BHI0_9NEIS|nr:AraC family transcriptional regulator [Jeongeupia naejangsanensis]MBM3114396.1 helix-turn-helix transcriptional regulator [Jeongeupia naejangsanensis]
MATIYYERFDLAPDVVSEVSRLVGAHVYHQASCPAMRQYGIFMCGVGRPDGPCEIERIDAPFHVLIVVLDGMAELFEGDQHWLVGPGQYGVLPMRGHRGYRRIGSEAMPHAWFLLGDEVRWEALNRGHPWVGSSKHGARLHDAVSLFQREAQLSNEGAHDALVPQTLELVSRQLERLLGLAGTRPAREQSLLQLLDDVRKAPDADWSVAVLCRRVGLGATQLHRLCVRRFGRAPAQLVFDVRMQLAREWLQDGRRVADVATALGYQEIASFSRRFSSHFGCAPSRVSKGKPS